MADETIELRLPSDLLAVAKRLAERDGVSIDHWFARVAARAIDEAGAGKDYFALRASRSQPGRLDAMLKRVPAQGPMPGDEIE